MTTDVPPVVPTLQDGDIADWLGKKFIFKDGQWLPYEIGFDPSPNGQVATIYTDDISPAGLFQLGWRLGDQYSNKEIEVNIEFQCNATVKTTPKTSKIELSPREGEKKILSKAVKITIQEM